MLDNIREWISDNLRYILLGLAAILVIIIIIFAIRMGTRSSSSGKSSDVAETELVTEEETEKKESLVRDEAEVLSTATDYWTAIGAKDYDTLETLCGKEFDDDDRAKVDAMDVAVESYDNITTYSKEGLTEGSYVAYVSMDLKLTGIETEAPTLREMYLQPGEDGSLTVVQSDDYTSEITTFTQQSQTEEDVQDLIRQVNDTLSERCKEDEDLANYVGVDTEESSGDDEDGEDGESSESSSALSVGTAMVNDGVNVRSDASTDSEILAALYAGLEVNVLETDVLDDPGNDWSRISYIDTSGSTVTGYVKSEYLTME